MNVAPSPTSFMFWRRRLTRLESAIYVCIVAGLIAVFADRALAYMELAEKLAMDATLITLRSGINARVAAEMLRGLAPVAAAWAGRNPFELAGATPPSFAAEAGADDLSSLERPAWTFDARRGEAVYLPRLRRTLVTADGTDALRFRLVGQLGSLGYQLVSTSGYEWEPF
jgi:hypothetical protein